MTDIAIREVGDELRLPPRDQSLKRAGVAIREALEADKTIAIAIPEGMDATKAQREFTGSAVRRWAQSRSWQVRVRTQGDELIIWREVLPEEPAA